MSENVYKSGEIWEDKDGDRWKVRPDGTLWGMGNIDHLESRTPEQVESDYSPLDKFAETPLSPSKYFGTEGPSHWLITNPVGSGVKSSFLNRDPVPDVPLAEMFTATVPVAVVGKAKASSGDLFPSDAFSVYCEAFDILLKKNADYGPSNIADSPGGPLNGILVRMWDKMSRLRHLVESGVTPENESLRDTLMDMANYSLIAMIVLDGNWPGMKEDDK